MLEILKKIVNDITTTAAEGIFSGFLVMLLMALSFMYINENGLKKALKNCLKAVTASGKFRKELLLAVCAGMVLSKTLINRERWEHPFSIIWKGWELYENGNAEGLENIIMLVPFGFILMWILRKKKLLTVIGASFIFSLAIETMQAVFQLGTFQFADLCYNTLGGFIGGVICLVISVIMHNHSEKT